MQGHLSCRESWRPAWPQSDTLSQKSEVRLEQALLPGPSCQLRLVWHPAYIRDSARCVDQQLSPEARTCQSAKC